MSRLIICFSVMMWTAAALGQDAERLVKDFDMSSAAATSVMPYGNATLTKVQDADKIELKVETVRRNSPNAQCGVQGEVGNISAGDVVRIMLVYRVVTGGELTLYLGPNREVGLLGLASTADEEFTADVPAKVGGNWRFQLVQNTSTRRGEFRMKKFAVWIVQQGDAGRFPIVTDGDMEQPNVAFYAPYNRVRLAKDQHVKKSGARSLHVQSYEDDRPSSVYAGVACNFGLFEAKVKLRISFDIKVAQGCITPMMTKGAFDKPYPAIGITDWQHVQWEYETPVNAWYSLIWTRTKDEPIEFWLDNVECKVVKDEQ